MSSEILSSDSQVELTPREVFGTQPIRYGNKYDHSTPLFEIWQKDRDYLLFAANLTAKKNNARPIGSPQFDLIRVANELTSGDKAAASKLYAQFSGWYRHAHLGEGLDELPRPTPKECRKILSETTVLAGHFDLDGIYSVASAIAIGGALGGPSGGDPARQGALFSRLRLLRYGANQLQEFTQMLAARAGEVVTIIDFAAHPEAALTLDHHATCLKFWELGRDLPCGIYDISMPSCPRLLATHCGLAIPEPILSGCDMVDGAQYVNVEQTIDLTNPYVALELSLQVDVSEPIAKKAVITLADNDLDPQSVLREPIWQARINLLALELEEQQRFWSKPRHIDTRSEVVAVADARLAPYPGARFRYLPFANDQVRDRPYLITIRTSGVGRTNLGLGRNPFYRDPSFFEYHPLNLGALAQELGKGGGRMEASSVTVETGDLDRVLSLALGQMERSATATER